MSSLGGIETVLCVLPWAGDSVKTGCGDLFRPQATSSAKNGFAGTIVEKIDNFFSGELSLEGKEVEWSASFTPPGVDVSDESGALLGARHSCPRLEVGGLYKVHDDPGDT